MLTIPCSSPSEIEGFGVLQDPKVLASISTALVGAILFYLKTTLISELSAKFEAKFDKSEEKFEAKFDKSEEKFEKQMIFQLLVLLVIGIIALIAIIKD